LENRVRAVLHVVDLQAHPELEVGHGCPDTLTCNAKGSQLDVYNLAAAAQVRAMLTVCH
jgi:hypothetical protein